MRKFLLALIVFVACVSIAKAGSYTAILSSYTVTSGSTSFTGEFPSIDGGVLIDKIILSTTNQITSPLAIGIYDVATSTYEATANSYIVMSGSSPYAPGQNQVVIDYPAHNPLKLSDPGFYKANGDTTHAVHINVQYR